MITLLINTSFNYRNFKIYTAEEFILNTISVSAYSYLKCCPSVLHAPVIPVLPHNSRNSSLFTANYKILHQLDVFLLLTVCVQNVDNFRKYVTSLKQILLFYIKLYLFFLCSRICLSTWYCFSYHTDFVWLVNVLLLSICCLICICLFNCSCNLCLYVVLFLYITNWLLNLQINNQEINWNSMSYYCSIELLVAVM